MRIYRYIRYRQPPPSHPTLSQLSASLMNAAPFYFGGTLTTIFTDHSKIEYTYEDMRTVDDLKGFISGPYKHAVFSGSLDGSHGRADGGFGEIIGAVRIGQLRVNKKLCKLVILCFHRV